MPQERPLAAVLQDVGILNASLEYENGLSRRAQSAKSTPRHVKNCIDGGAMLIRTVRKRADERHRLVLRQTGVVLAEPTAVSVKSIRVHPRL